MAKALRRCVQKIHKIPGMGGSEAELRTAHAILKLLNLPADDQAGGQLDDLVSALQELSAQELAVVVSVSDIWVEKQRSDDEPAAVLDLMATYAQRSAGDDALVVFFFADSGQVAECRQELLRQYPQVFCASRDAVQAGITRSTAPTTPLAHTVVVRRIGSADFDISNQQVFYF